MPAPRVGNRRRTSSPDRQRLSYFDRYPQNRGPSSSTLSPNLSHRSASARDSYAGGDEDSEDDEDGDDERSQYAFPIVDVASGSGEVTPKGRGGGGSSRTDRISASSSLSQVETPPQTPIDFSVPRQLVVNLTDVGEMDAMVDGLNGYDHDSDSLFAARSPRKDRFHPLYAPPLPTPPPGVKLGGAMPRSKKDKALPRSPSIPSLRPPSARSAGASTSTLTLDGPPSPAPSSYVPPSPSRRNSRNMAPSISDIIRAHAPPEQQVRFRQTSVRTSFHGHAVPEESEPEPVPDVEADMLTRSSVDSIADEVARTLRVQSNPPARAVAPPPVQTGLYLRSAPSRHSVVSETAAYGYGAQSLDGASTSNLNRMSFYSSPAAVPEREEQPSISLPPPPKPTQEQSIAQYLKSPRLTTLLKLTRAPHAGPDNPLTVSLCDLGAPRGVPLLVFLGLGTVRYMLGLYDEMAECLGIRIIAIDRWGMGRTDAKHKGARGIPEWAGAVEEVLDKLGIEQCAVMAHSAGAPYALSFAARAPRRVRGDVCLLAPWVGGVEASGYKWLKYVPNGLLKAAQGAEWKIQAWMLGKPPTIQYKGIGYSMPTSAATSAPHSSPSLSSTSTSVSSRKRSTKDKERPGTAQPLSPITPTQTRMSNVSSPKGKRSGSADGRPSTSSVFSDYDDLRDFDGRFDSRSTLGRPSTSSNPRTRASSEARRPGIPRKPSRGFLGIGGMLTKHSNNSHSPTSFTMPVAATAPSSPVVPPTRRPALKALRSMGSLRGRNTRGPTRVEQEVEVPPVPLKLDVDVGLGLDGDGWMDTVRAKYAPPPIPIPAALSSSSPVRPGSGHGHGGTRDGGRRSISLTGGVPLGLGMGERSRERGKERAVEVEPASPGITASSAYQAALGNALIAASHAEAHARGTHADLLAILNHTGSPWGFSYASYPHAVRVWYGDRDEKIAEHAVRWMEKEMIGGGRGVGGRGRCEVKVVKGADHGLMYRSSVVIEVLELVRDAWVDVDGDADAGPSRRRRAESAR
ncbi:hypothetical protein PENSPDRAFT_730777 [Peniophora sp. CONT]|nr:hypothetical protein PENSPDRAFT_730777 [Peniophora sp. CONT]